jgi:hypothetical protein
MKIFMIKYQRDLMRNLAITVVIGLLVQQVAQGQGTVYLSNLDQTPTGNNAVGSDSWLAYGFLTGTNSTGYSIDSIQLGLANAAGNPNGFNVMIYSSIGDLTPGSSLSALSGSDNPSAAGNYTYTPASSLTLSAGTAYFIVVTGGTVVANGAYEWNYVDTYSYDENGGWVAPLGIFSIANYQSSDGSSWNPVEGLSQFAITAEAIPEPGVLTLCALVGLSLLCVGRKAKPVQ